jgi:hypothetical protein
MLPPRAYAFIGLNIIRVLSVIALLLVLASNAVTLANDIKAVNRFAEGGKAVNVTSSNPAVNGTMEAFVDMDYIMGSTVPNQPAGAFWAVLNRLFIIFQTIVLILSEFGFPAQFFDRFFPVLGKDFGLGALGLFQMLLGAAILSHRVDTFTLVSAFFLFSLGCLNVLLGLIFRESAKSKRSVTSWREHAKSALPSYTGPANVLPTAASPPPPSFVSHLYTGSSMGSHHGHGHSKGSSSWSYEKGSYDEKEKEKYTGFGFGRQGEKAAAMQGYLLSKPVESLPRYAPKAEGR